MEKTHVVVDSESLKKLLNCFADTEEFHEFMGSVVSLIQEITFSLALQERSRSERQVLDYQTAKQIFIISMFLRENYDLIQNLVHAVNYKLVTKDEADILKQDENYGYQ